MTTPHEEAEQIAALPIRWDARGQLRVLMVTSRDTGRWVMPKGWHMDGKKPWNAAEIEALEEAGATGFISHKPIGTYRYVKRLEADEDVLCTVTIYPMLVQDLKIRWKERAARKRHWFSAKEAARLVDEPELSEILIRIAQNPDGLTLLQELREACPAWLVLSPRLRLTTS